jgi:ABC-2 type transport system permease protein
MKELRLAKKIIKTLLKDRIQYPGRLFADTLTTTARCTVLLLLYYYVFNLKGGSINNTTFIVAAWSIFFYFAFMNLGLRNIARLIMADVQSGNIEVLLNKPISYLLYRSWWQIGSGLYSFLVVTFLGSVALALIIGVPSTMTIALFLPTIFLTFLMASVLSLLIYIIVGLLSFWIIDINPIFWIIDKMVMILGGSYLPVALFPKFLYQISIYSPFGASQFMTHTVYESWQTDWFTLIAIQIFWIIILGVGTYFLFNRVKKKVSVNGG